MSYSVIGRCSLCGGTVSLPTFYYSVLPPVATCSSCGATRENDLPVVPMTPRPLGEPNPFRPFQPPPTHEPYQFPTPTQPPMWGGRPDVVC